MYHYETQKKNSVLYISYLGNQFKNVMIFYQRIKIYLKKMVINISDEYETQVPTENEFNKLNITGKL